MEVGAGEEGWAWCTLSSSCSHHANGNIFTGGFKKVPDIRLCNTQSPWVLQVGKKQGLKLEPREQAALRSVWLISCLSQPLCAAVVPAASLWICCQPSGREFRPRLTLILGKLRSVTWSGWWIHELTQSGYLTRPVKDHAVKAGDSPRIFVSTLFVITLSTPW